MPRIDRRILPALAEEDVQRLLAACLSARDKAIVLVLLDTGCRAAELVGLVGRDIDLQSGEVHICAGKGGKDRIVFIGYKTRKHLLRYFMGTCTPAADELVWGSEKTCEPLMQSGLNQLLKRLGKCAGVAHCSPHTLRRTFALWSLRSGMDIYTLARLMGHTDITVLRQYLALTDLDLAKTHQRHGLVDHLAHQPQLSLSAVGRS